MFPFCKDNDSLTADYGEALVDDVVIHESTGQMEMSLSLKKPAPPLELRAIEDLIAAEDELESVTLKAYYARPEPQAKGKKGKKGEPPKPGSIIMGRRIAGKPTPIGEVTIESGKAVVKGEVCDVSHKELEKSGAWIMSFDITDYTGTINVSKFLKEDGAAKTVNSIQKGMWLDVSGSIGISKKYDGDPCIEPQNIVVIDTAPRRDFAEESRGASFTHENVRN